MAKLEVLDWNKKKVGEVDVSAEVFEGEVRKDVLHSVVRWQLAKRRQGSHKAKTKGEVSGGGKKPFKQKGTGNARQGSSRSPLLEGGGVIFPPSPRNYEHKLNRRYKQAGLRSALSFLNSNVRLFVANDMQSDEGKTKELSQRLAQFGASKAVLIDVEIDGKFQRACRNLAKYRYYSPEGMNVYDLLKFDTAIITKGSLEKIQQRCGVEG